MTIRLVTERLILRSWEDGDYEALAAIQGDARVRRFYPRTLTREETVADIDAAREKERLAGYHFGAAELKETGETIGLIGIGVVPEKTRAAIPSHPEVEVGWVLAERFWGQGLAVEGARAWLDYAWSLGVPEVVAFTAQLNLPSQRVMQKLGMTHRVTDDYEHPSVPDGSPLKRHVVYAISRPATTQA